MSNTSVLKVRLSFKGRPLRTYTFTDDVITVGRDPDADICLDNTGVSRQHAKIEKTPHGFYLEDTGSANGTFLNDEPVSRNRLCDQDVIRIGKFSLWIALEVDRRGTEEETKRTRPEAFQGTTVLTNDQLARVMASAKQAEEAPDLRVVTMADTAESRAPEESTKGRFDRSMLIIMGVSVLIGSVVGAVVISFLSK